MVSVRVSVSVVVRVSLRVRVMVSVWLGSGEISDRRAHVRYNIFFPGDRSVWEDKSGLNRDIPVRRYRPQGNFHHAFRCQCFVEGFLY